MAAHGMGWRLHRAGDFPDEPRARVVVRRKLIVRSGSPAQGEAREARGCDFLLHQSFLSRAFAVRKQVSGVIKSGGPCFNGVLLTTTPCGFRVAN